MLRQSSASRPARLARGRGSGHAKVGEWCGAEAGAKIRESAPPDQRGGSMTKDPVAAFIDRHMEAWNQRSPDILCLDHAEDGVVLSPMFGRVQSRPQICASYASLFVVFPDWEIRFERPIV